MTNSTSSFGAPACAAGSDSQLAASGKITTTIQLFWRRFLRMIFGCAHPDDRLTISIPPGNTQTCIDCGAWRPVQLADLRDGGGIHWAGNWRHKSVGYTQAAPPVKAPESAIDPGFYPANPQKPSVPSNCCMGIDTPGVGIRHDANCPILPNGLSAKPIHLTQGASDASTLTALRGYLRERLVRRLIAAARALAEPQIQRAVRTFGASAACLDCGRQSASVDGEIVHAAWCKTGAVLSAIAELEKDAAAVWDSQLNTIEKEVQPAERVGHAGDGIRPRGDFGEPWRMKTRRDLGCVQIFDADGCLLFVLDAKGSRCDAALEIAPIAARIVDCVNSAVPAHRGIESLFAGKGGAQ